MSKMRDRKVQMPRINTNSADGDRDATNFDDGTDVSRSPFEAADLKSVNGGGGVRSEFPYTTNHKPW